MQSHTDPMPAGAANTRPLWAAIIVLGVAVIALGASLVHMQTRQTDGQAPFAAFDPLPAAQRGVAPATPAAVPASADARLPVTMVAADEVVVASDAARNATGGATRTATPVATKTPAATEATGYATRGMATHRAVSSAPAAPAAISPAPSAAAAPPAYIVTESGLVLPAPTSAPAIGAAVVLNDPAMAQTRPIARTVGSVNGQASNNVPPPPPQAKVYGTERN